MRDTQREDTVLIPPTVEEMLRTVFIGGIPERLGEEERWMERILGAVGNLRRWLRAYDENGKACRFGFAEFEDPKSVGCAYEVLKDLEIPGVGGKEGGKLLVTLDEKSKEYLESIEEAHGDQLEFAVDNARKDLERILGELKDPSKPSSSDDTKPESATKDSESKDTPAESDGPQPEIVTIQLSADDELSDIPADMREMVAKEIAAFRDRSNRRDLERLKREEEVERLERQRHSGGRINRLSSPPPSAPTGPSAGSNSIPLTSSRIPTGPSSLSSGQLPRDYQQPVKFLNGTSKTSSTSVPSYYTPEEEASDASDSELESRRQTKRAQDAEKQYLDAERRWLNRERARTSALDRERLRDDEDLRRAAADAEAMKKRLEEWDDDVEAANRTEEYYRDKSLWIRTRTAFRQREAELDDRDRAQEQRELEREGDKKRAAASAADSFLSNLTIPSTPTGPSTQQPQKFKLSLTHTRPSSLSTPRRKKTAPEVEALLDSEDDPALTKPRKLIPITYDTTSNDVMDDETRERLVRQLAQEIPTDREGLFGWDVKWEFVDEAMIQEKLKPFVEKKIVEYIGVLEEELVGFVVGWCKKRGRPEELVKELEMVRYELG